MRIKQLAFMAVLTATVSGCTSVQDPFLTAATSTAAAPAISSEVAAGFATVVLPATAGPVATVRQIVRDGYLQQSIVYGNATALAGENLLTVDFGSSDTDSRYLRAPTKRQILADMRAALPGIKMSIQDVIGDNQQGVFGYATGTMTSGGSCLYGWQLAKGGSEAGGTTLAANRGKRYAAQVRLRFCSDALGPQAIVQLMQGLKVKPVTRATIEMLRFAEGSGAPAGTVQLQAVPARAEEVAEPVRPARNRRLPAANAGEDASADTRTAVSVPLPGTGADGIVATVEKRAALIGEPARSIDDAALVPLPQ